MNFAFLDNVALTYGGAINLYTIDKQEIKLSTTCFLQCNNRQEVNAFGRRQLSSRKGARRAEDKIMILLIEPNMKKLFIQEHSYLA